MAVIAADCAAVDAGTRRAEGQRRLRGAVTLIQCFGSAADLNIHTHCLVLHGVCSSGADGVSEFVRVDVPTDDELHALVLTPVTRLMNLLTRRGVLLEETGQTDLAAPNSDCTKARSTAC